MFLLAACLALGAGCGRGAGGEGREGAPAVAGETVAPGDDLPAQIFAEHPVPAPGTPAALRPGEAVSFLDGGAEEEAAAQAPELHLAVADLAASAAFYGDVLGFTIEAATPAEPPHRRMELARDGVRLVLRRRDDLAAELPRPDAGTAEAAAPGEDAGATADAEEAAVPEATAPRSPAPAASALHAPAGDLDALLRRVEEAGAGTARLGETADGSRRLAVRDPDGHVLVFVEILPETPD